MTAHVETIRRALSAYPSDSSCHAALAALLAVGERDRRQIARLTEALERIASPRYIGNRDSTKEFVRAVLAGEEDARP